MARIVCFTDQEELIRVTRQGLHVCGHTLSALSASSLSDTIRHAVQCLAPELILLEISHTLDNPHLFFFLRSDSTTREVPIIVVSDNAQIEQHAAILGAQGHLTFPFTPEQICQLVQALLPKAILAIEASGELASRGVASRPFGTSALRRIQRQPMLQQRSVGAAS
jgi:CheY-like chemotaxis protein